MPNGPVPEPNVKPLAASGGTAFRESSECCPHVVRGRLGIAPAVYDLTDRTCALRQAWFKQGGWTTTLSARERIAEWIGEFLRRMMEKQANA